MDRCPICGELLAVSTPEWSENGAIEIRCIGCGDAWIEDSWSEDEVDEDDDSDIADMYPLEID